MESLRRNLTRICNCYAIFLKVVVSALVPLLILTVTYQIIARHVEAIPRFLWTEEICRFSLNWLVMIGASLAVRNNDHFDIDVLTRLTPRGRKIRFIVVNFAVLVAVLIFAVYGWEFAASGLRRKSMAANLSMVWVYSSFVFFGISSLLFQIEKFIVFFTKSEAQESQPA